MKKTLRLILLGIFLLTLALTGCTRAIGNKPLSDQPTPTGEMDFMTKTPVTSSVATQTAQAKETPLVVTATPGEKQPDVVATTAPEATKAPSKAIPTLARPTTYTLQKGEFPICIARRFDLDLGRMFADNNLNMNSRPSVGAVLKISSSGNWNSNSYGARALRAHTDYRVNAGDTVYTIACYFGDVSPEGILAANNLNSASDVKSGMTLKIP